MLKHLLFGLFDQIKAQLSYFQSLATLFCNLATLKRVATPGLRPAGLRHCKKAMSNDDGEKINKKIVSLILVRGRPKMMSLNF